MGKEAELPVAGPAEQRSSALIPLPSAPLHFPNPKHDVIPKVQPPSHISGTAQTDRAITADTHTHTHTRARLINTHTYTAQSIHARLFNTLVANTHT